MADEKKDYRNTLNLPQTTFPMRADLVKKEPEILERWEKERLYHQIQAKNEGRPKFILHDGPPYANGNIHFGHILNKVLKDVIVKYKNMSGFQSPFVPGWDCHGLPIEHQVDRDLGPKKKGMTKVEIRKACREYAMRFVTIQRDEFKRLGILADWERPYLTMDYAYEATIAREFGRFVEQGNIYKGLRPVLWCPRCRTALAEAEIEHEDHESPSIYVRFPVIDDLGDIHPRLKGQKISIVIWTTTPWTLPANLAVALHENYDYVVVPFRAEWIIVAKQLVGTFFKLFEQEAPEAICRFSGRKLERRLCRHPFLERSSLIVLSDHVSIDTGTGCVHIAPGHGTEDHEVGLRYGLKTLTPVDHDGKFTNEAGVPEWEGLKVMEANPQVLSRLQETGMLVREEKIRHMYPHCWRCKQPVIFRATEQWFLSLSKNDVRAKALDAIRRVQWVPAWGRERIYGMIENRPDWCLSRQRSWGVPIIAFRCERCDHLLLENRIIQSIADRFEKEGADIWFSELATDGATLLPQGLRCPSCNGGSWIPEQDILDVWFDSGVSFAAVLEKDPRLAFPASLYLEGSDQHRGWFHSSLLAAIGTRGRPPYQTVLTHGFVVDSQGKKYSKSVGNYIPPDKVLNENGAEILRLWVAAEDYRNDIRVSKEIFTRLVEAYRKIRNTCRFLLGNLYDFDFLQTGGQMGGGGAVVSEIDRWAMHSLQKLILKMKEAYEGFNFHIIFHELNRYCTVDLSAFYLDILKDRLYTSAKNDPARRGSQWVLFEMTRALARIMAPILSFTAEEVWQHLPAFPGKAASIHLADFPTAHPDQINEALAGRWENFRTVRDEVLKALELARQKKVIGNSLEAKLVVIADGDPQSLLEGFGDSVRELLQVSQFEWGTDVPTEAYWKSDQFPSFFISVEHADGGKCARCWAWSATVGLLSDHPRLCSRCRDLILS